MIDLVQLYLYLGFRPSVPVKVADGFFCAGAKICYLCACQFYHYSVCYNPN